WRGFAHPAGRSPPPLSDGGIPTMRKLKLTCAAALAAALTAATLVAPAPTRAVESAAPTGYRGDMMQWIKAAEDELVQLSDAMPESKYSWRPGKDVRSVAEVYMHVATANYGVPSLCGVTPPAGFDMKTYEKSLTKKADVRKAMMDSFTHMENAFTNFSDADLEKPVELFGMNTTVRGAYMLL